MKRNSTPAATKIVCTIGPSSSSPGTLAQLVRAGMDVARINFAHGDHDEHIRTIRTVRQVSRRLHRPVAILQDLPGPKLRVGKLATQTVQLRRHDRVVLSTGRDSARGKIPVMHQDFPKAVKPGDTVFMADGSIKIQVLDVIGDDVKGHVLTGGELTSGKGVNVPKLRLRLPAITKRDVESLKVGLENDVEIAAVSFVQRADDVRDARKIIRSSGKNTLVLAKIEKREAVQDLDAITAEADGVMVARGDLGVEIALERVPIIQKRIIHEANRLGKPVVTATQMLESMVSSPSPTRAEVTDVANAIIDGTDAVMLSEETAVGRYPVEAVAVMNRVARETEKFLPRDITPQRRAWREHSQEDALALAACETALQVSASAIVTPTRTGQTARRVAKYHPPLPIVALTSSETVRRQLCLSWGVHALLSKESDSTEAIFAETERVVKAAGFAERGDSVVIVAGDPKGPTGRTDLLKIHPIP